MSDFMSRDTYFSDTSEADKNKAKGGQKITLRRVFSVREYPGHIIFSMVLWTYALVDAALNGLNGLAFLSVFMLLVAASRGVDACNDPRSSQTYTKTAYVGAVVAFITLGAWFAVLLFVDATVSAVVNSLSSDSKHSTKSASHIASTTKRYSYSDSFNDGLALSGDPLAAAAHSDDPYFAAATAAGDYIADRYRHDS
ncbi:hypothetical protein NFC81_12910 [Salinispirillum sp. LH 10-3-1]|uniref:DUF805 domain-containing protein n=1 Tax=Salinispirillum sp. LH 10-3-1 TaxID=2952525 RepID=A0AB38YE08_9GAMM